MTALLSCVSSVAMLSAASAQLDEIIVTAEKREKSLQDTPISITAYTAEELEQLRITQPDEIGLYAPNVTAPTQAASATTVNFSIRGITNTEPILSVDQAVGFYIDGIYRGRNNALSMDVLDLERIEVLRGPHGTLYGRNSTGGAINVVTSKPQEEFGFRQDFSVGNLGLFQSRTTIDTGELFGGLSAQFSYLSKNRDGFVENTTPNPQAPPVDDFGSENVEGWRAALRWRPNERFLGDYSYDHSESSNMPGAFQLTGINRDQLFGPNADRSAFALGPSSGPTMPGVNAFSAFESVVGGAFQGFGNTLSAPLCSFDPACLAFANTPNAAFGGASPAAAILGSIEAAQAAGEAALNADRRVDSLSLPFQGLENVETNSHALTLQFDVNENITLKSLTGYSTLASDANTDLSGGGFLETPTSIVTLFAARDNVREQSQFSQELQLLGTFDRLEFIGGLFFLSEEASEQTQQSVVLQLGNFGVRQDYEVNNKAYAVFGQFTYTPAILDDRLHLTAGGRWTKDERELNQIADSVGASGTFSEDFSNFTWNVVGSFDWTDTINTYAKVVTGYRAGGFLARTDVALQAPFDEETVISYEVGLKSEFFDRRVRLNAAFFYTEYEDLQVSQFVPGANGAQTTLQNAASANYTGGEIELTVNPVEGLSFYANAGFVDPQYDSFSFLDPTGLTCGVPDTVCDVRDLAQFRSTSEETYSFGAQYDFPSFGFADLSARVDVIHDSGYVHDLIPSAFNDVIRSGSFTLVNGRVILSNIDVGGGAIRAGLWAKNIFDEQYRVFGIGAFEPLGFGGAVFNEPRTWGFDLTWEYN